jgi:hypothetical protein
MWADDNGQAFSSDVGGVNTGTRGSLINIAYGRNVQAFCTVVAPKQTLTKT